MIRLPDTSLPPATQTWLEELQQSVDGLPTYDLQVKEASEQFERRRRSAGFRPVLETLEQMCSGVRRCCYCEDSQATEVEHIWPKNIYPNLVFAWGNYLYGCTRCNRPKSSICDIYREPDNTRLSVPRFVKQHKRPPPSGMPLLINPRLENPLEFMILEMQDTFFFMSSAEKGTRRCERAEYTISLLKLNDEDVLPKCRAEAYVNYRDRLGRYVKQKLEGQPLPLLQHTMNSLRRMHHPTVWQEIKRQRTFPHHQEFNQLFEAAPEALDW